MIKLKRVHEPAASDDGARFLVERLWPRGIKKTSLRLDSWAKDVAPSDGLRRWFSHDPAKWGEFSCRYFGELNVHPDSWKPLLDAARRGTVSLLYSSHDQEHNNAVALKQYLEERLREKTSHQSAA